MEYDQAAERAKLTMQVMAAVLPLWPLVGALERVPFRRRRRVPALPVEHHVRAVAARSSHEVVVDGRRVICKVCLQNSALTAASLWANEGCQHASRDAVPGFQILPRMRGRVLGGTRVCESHALLHHRGFVFCAQCGAYTTVGRGVNVTPTMRKGARAA